MSVSIFHPSNGVLCVSSSYSREPQYEPTDDDTLSECLYRIHLSDRLKQVKQSYSSAFYGMKDPSATRLEDLRFLLDHIRDGGSGDEKCLIRYFSHTHDIDIRPMFCDCKGPVPAEDCEIEFDYEADWAIITGDPTTDDGVYLNTSDGSLITVTDGVPLSELLPEGSIVSVGGVLWLVHSNGASLLLPELEVSPSGTPGVNLLQVIGPVSVNGILQLYGASDYGNHLLWAGEDFELPDTFEFSEGMNSFFGVWSLPNGCQYPAITTNFPPGCTYPRDHDCLDHDTSDHS